MLENINIVPITASSIPSRDKVDISTEFCGSKLEIPIIAAPMVDVADSKSLKAICDNGCFGLSHRFQSIENQLHDVKNLTKAFGCSIGVNDYAPVVDYLLNVGIKTICIDTANGCTEKVKKAIQYIKQASDSTYVIAGNVISLECFKILEDWGADAVRLSIGTGTGCKTKIETGIYRDPVNILGELLPYTTKVAKIIDGGIKTPAHLAKCLALGADMVMIGGLFASCKDSPARWVNGKKSYRGSASKERHLGDSKYTEGVCVLLETHDHEIADIVTRFKHGLKSTLSYCDCHNLEEFKSSGDKKYRVEW